MQNDLIFGFYSTQDWVLHFFPLLISIPSTILIIFTNHHAHQALLDWISVARMVGTGSVSHSPAISELMMVVMLMMTPMMRTTIALMMMMFIRLTNLGFWMTTSRAGRVDRSIARTGEQVDISSTFCFVFPFLSYVAVVCCGSCHLMLDICKTMSWSFSRNLQILPWLRRT